MMNVIKQPDATLTRILSPVSPQPNARYIPSLFSLPFEHRGKQYVFHTLTKQCMEGSLPSSAMTGQGVDDLIRAHFLVPEGKDECAWYNQISSLMRVYSRKHGIRTYTILPTFTCNAKCIYCYEEGMPQSSMTPDTIEQVIRFILETHEDRKVKLSWFGGEPLLGEHVIDRICAALKAAGVDFRSNMISNGSLITPWVVKKMSADWKLEHIQISMDGWESDYVCRKRYVHYRDDYHQVMKAVSAMSAAGIAVTIRCNVDEENWDNIPKFLQDLESGVANKDRVSLYFAPLNAVRSSDQDLPVWEKILAIRPSIMAAGLHASTMLGSGLHFRIHHCMADEGSVVITPDGSLYACEHCPQESRFGDIWHGVTDAEGKKEFCRADVTREKCRTCPFLPHCTSFTACPVTDYHCREVMQMIMIEALKRMVDQKENANSIVNAAVC